MTDRAAYVEALQVERLGIANRPESVNRTRRLKDIDAALAQYAPEPGPAAPLETAAPPKPRARRATSSK